MELVGEAEPVGATFALALALDEVLGQQLLDVVIGARAAQLHQLRLQEALFQGDRGQGAQGGGGEIQRQQILYQIPEALPQLQPIAAPLLADLQGRVAVGVVGHQGEQTQLRLVAIHPGDLGDLGQGEGLALQVQDRLDPGRQGERHGGNQVGWAQVGCPQVGRPGTGWLGSSCPGFSCPGPRCRCAGAGHRCAGGGGIGGGAHLFTGPARS